MSANPDTALGHASQNTSSPDGAKEMRAVSDGVNVGYDVYRIKTKVTEAGGKVDKGFLIDHRSKASRKARQEVLADDLDYTPADLDRSVVVPDQPSGARSTGREACPQGERGCARQIHTILRTYRDVVQTELFPGRALVPKTLIFAKDDSHAEDIVHLCREVFGKGNDFCKKIIHKGIGCISRRSFRITSIA